MASVKRVCQLKRFHAQRNTQSPLLTSEVLYLLRCLCKRTVLPEVLDLQDYSFGFEI